MRPAFPNSTLHISAGKNLYSDDQEGASSDKGEESDSSSGLSSASQARPSSLKAVQSPVTSSSLVVNTGNRRIVGHNVCQAGQAFLPQIPKTVHQEAGLNKPMVADSPATSVRGTQEFFK